MEQQTPNSGDLASEEFFSKDVQRALMEAGFLAISKGKRMMLKAAKISPVVFLTCKSPDLHKTVARFPQNVDC